MKKYLFITAFLFFSTIIKAQNPVVQLPDSVGKYLFELFINNADITHSKVTCIGWDGMIPKDVWATLLINKDESGLNLNPQTTTYYNTSYELNSNANLYVSMEAEGKIYAFNVTARWIDNHWQVEEISSDLYSYSETTGFDNITSESNTDSDIVYDLDDDVYDDQDDINMLNKIKNYKYNKNFKSTVIIDNPQTLPTPESFSRRVLDLLSQEAPYGSGEIFLTRQEYLDTKGAEFIDMLNRWTKNGEYSVDEESQNIYNNPGILFDEFASNWKMLPTSLKEELGGIKKIVLKDLNIQNLGFTIENSKKKNLNIPAISTTILMDLNYKGKLTGIQFSAIWYNGMWKLSNIEGAPYLISSAEIVTEDAIIEPEE